MQTFIVILNFVTFTFAYIGYDCGPACLNTSSLMTFSLLDTAECDFHEQEVNSTKTNILLLQIAEFKNTKVIQCKIEIRRTIYHCGMFGHLIPAEHGQQEFIYEVSAEKCNKIHQTGYYKHDPTHIIAGIKQNSTITTPMDFAGSAYDKTCTGVQYSDNYGSWSNVFVQGTIKITISEYFAQVNLNSNKIRLSSGTTCTYSDLECIDLEGGFTFWKTLNSDNCISMKYDILFKGTATKIQNIVNQNSEIIYALNNNEITFALQARDTFSFCGGILIKTEHPKLFIVEQKNNINIFDNQIRSHTIETLDLFTYINSKFVYVEKHVRTQVEKLYNDIIMQKCKLERKTLQNSLSIANLSPDEFAYNIVKAPGYIARVAGEVVYIIRCMPIEVKIAHLDVCYAELPVKKLNETWFLKPKTHILTRTGTQVECNSILPPMFKLTDEWIKLLPKPTSAKDPQLLKPNTQKTWTYTSIKNFATSGVYTQQDIEKLQDYIMFPIEKPAIINDIARGFSGNHPINDNYDTISTNIIKKLASDTWKTIKEEYMSFSIVSSGIIMIFVIFHIIKLIIDTIIQGYTLHAIYGWSIHLLAAVFSSITHLLITLHKKDKNLNVAENQDLQEVIIIPNKQKRPQEISNLQDDQSTSFINRIVIAHHPNKSSTSLTLSNKVVTNENEIYSTIRPKFKQRYILRVPK